MTHYRFCATFKAIIKTFSRNDDTVHITVKVNNNEYGKLIKCLADHVGETAMVSITKDLEEGDND